jgi:hypothetical protein
VSRTGQLDVGGEVNDSASSGTKNDRTNDGATATGFLDWNDQAGESVAWTGTTSRRARGRILGIHDFDLVGLILLSCLG